jgi:hypothetical protein
MKQELMNELNRILIGSKRFNFEYGDYGMTVLELTNYNTGATVKIDLGKLMEEYPDVMEDIIIEQDDEEDYE